VRLRPLLVASLAALAISAPRLPAQENPALQEAARLVAEGRGEEARQAVAAELARARPGEPAYVEALFWRARLTMFGDSAERDLRRVAIEYPASPWADDALLLLAQMAMAAGNPVSSFSLAERLRSDYPDSDLRPAAAFWAGRAAFDLGDQRAACALLDSARTEAASDVEFVNRVEFYRSRCGALAAGRSGPPVGPAAPQAAPVPDTGRRRVDTSQAVAGQQDRQPARQAVDSARGHVSQPPAPAPGRIAAAQGWAVQVAAVQADAEEQRVLEQLRRAGYRGVAVPGPGRYRRIRVGGFASEAEARGAIAALRRVVGGQPFAVRER